MPGAARFCVSGMIGRAPMSMFGLGTVLLVAATTGRYGLAGLVSGAGSIGYAMSAPQVARLADRFGQHRVLRPLIAVFAVRLPRLRRLRRAEGAGLGPDDHRLPGRLVDAVARVDGPGPVERAAA